MNRKRGYLVFIPVLVTTSLVTGCASASYDRNAHLDELEAGLTKAMDAKSPDVRTFNNELIKAIVGETDLGVLDTFAQKYAGTIHAVEANARIDGLLRVKKRATDLLTTATRYSQQPTLLVQVYQRLLAVISEDVDLLDLQSAVQSSKDADVLAAAEQRIASQIAGSNDLHALIRLVSLQSSAFASSAAGDRAEQLIAQWSSDGLDGQASAGKSGERNVSSKAAEQSMVADGRSGWSAPANPGVNGANAYPNSDEEDSAFDLLTAAADPPIAQSALSKSAVSAAPKLHFGQI